MYVDPTGDFAIFTSMLFTSILFGFVTGALSTGYKAKKDNLSLENVILAGFDGGLVGAEMCLGGAAGLASTGAFIDGFSLSLGTSLVISSGITGVATFTDYYVNGIAYNKDLNFGAAFLNFVKAGLQGTITFGVGYLGGMNHMFDKMLGNDMVDVHRLLTIDSKKSIISKALLLSDTLFGPTITKDAFFGGSAWFLRKIIEWIFRL